MFKIEVEGLEPLQAELSRLSKVRADGVIQKQTADMLRRARQPGGTPVDTGELRQSSNATKDEMGYTAEYAFQSCGAYKTGQKRQKLSLRVA